MSWIYTSLQWYFMLAIMGLIFFPTAKKMLGKVFYDDGYAFSKVIAILIISYVVFVFGSFKLIAFTQKGILFIIGSGILLNIFLLFRQSKQRLQLFSYQKLLMIVFEELLFLASFLFWIYVRGQEPSIKDLEKMMDY